MSDQLSPPEVFALARGQLDQFVAQAHERLRVHSSDEVTAHLIARMPKDAVHLAALAIVDLARKGH